MARSIHVAIVDDDSSVCQALSRLLRLMHIQATGYASAEAFLAASPRPSFDCLVFDIRLSGMSGLELLAKLAADRPHPPVIIITAVDDPALRARAEALGCAAYFNKSAPGSAVVAVIRSATADTQRSSKRTDI
jgi:FixJ family two-component response regulator